MTTTYDENAKNLLARFLSMKQPLVTVICTSYNHERYVERALESVIGQTYPAVELIVVDNGSSDGTVDRIAAFCEKHSQVRFLRQPENLGLGRAFNLALKQARGQFVIDLSADDLLYPERIERQVAVFAQLPADYAVVFSNAALVDGQGRVIGHHYPLDRQGKALPKVPSGSLFRQILSSYLICAPTMMIRRDVLESIGGYDETLTYEDFDFWVRTTRHYRYHYLDEVLTGKRVLKQSQSAQFSRRGNPLLPSTLTVCYKAFDQCQSADEYQALARRLKWSIRQCFYTQHYQLAFEFEKLLSFMEEPDWKTKLFLSFCRLRLPVNSLYRQYVNWQRQQRTSMYVIN